MRIAVAQMPGAELADWLGTLRLVRDLIVRAADQGARLVVLPECAWPAYHLGSRAAYVAARAGGLPPAADFLTALRELARARRIAVCAGYVEENGARLYNSACLIDADGELRGVHRKCFLWAFDREWFAPGDRSAAFDAGFARVGLMVCADARLPEIPATLAARGAQLILQPTAWVNAGTPAAPWNPQPDFLIPARAIECGVPIASASKWGREGDTEFVGSSLICDADGRVVAQCGARETTIAVADVTPRRALPAVLSAAQRAVLSAATPALRPAADAPALHVVALPVSTGTAEVRAAVERIAAERAGQHVLCVGRAAGPGDGARPPIRAGGAVGVCAAEEEPFDLDGARLATASDTDARTFPALRCLALRGVHLIVVFGDDVASAVVRARACENRIFVVWARAAGVTIIDPDGRCAATVAWPADRTTECGAALDLRRSANKAAASNTDVLADRRPEQYAF